MPVLESLIRTNRRSQESPLTSIRASLRMGGIPAASEVLRFAGRIGQIFDIFVRHEMVAWLGIWTVNNSRFVPLVKADFWQLSETSVNMKSSRQPPMGLKYLRHIALHIPFNMTVGVCYLLYAPERTAGLPLKAISGAYP